MLVKNRNLMPERISKNPKHVSTSQKIAVVHWQQNNNLEFYFYLLYNLLIFLDKKIIFIGFPSFLFGVECGSLSQDVIGTREGVVTRSGNPGFVIFTFIEDVNYITTLISIILREDYNETTRAYRYITNNIL